ncbi:DUF1972 domain-containing protein [Devosia submarina]|uniref:DUF1972 domain-containing protein n=1 Tax=Devosia submarina TaxID=1173082 RepID=UPI000D378DB0|nr:DUF1972 domain-containing protein [Devosia submarina]
MSKKIANILGIRGIPAAHGGFETFAGRLAPYLRDRGWEVNVYCQIEPDQDGILRSNFEDDWNGIRRIHIGSSSKGSVGSIKFDWYCIRDAVKRPGVNLVLGYNTALFGLLLRIAGRSMVINMDGVEWKRAKWSMPIKLWFYLNEFFGANIANVPIADHPEIALHLRRHGCTRSVVIPYGADAIHSASREPLDALGLHPDKYFISIARAEPENSILEIVEAFSASKRQTKLVVLGKLDSSNPYHQAVRRAASQSVIFPGAIYDSSTVASLRFHALAYIHGHQVGGTNPSLVEALGAGNLIIAHDNKFNRWVAGPEQLYFSQAEECAAHITAVETAALEIGLARKGARLRHATAFTWEQILAKYEQVLEAQL